MYYFCTYFDQHYLSRGLALYRSLSDQAVSFQLWALCLDQDSYDSLARLNLPNIRLIALKDFEQGDRELLQAKQNRSRVEYYFTCTPSLLLFILKNYPDVDLITYLDADLFFFADPAPIYEEIAAHSIAIIEHRYPPQLRERETRGIYNVGWLSFRNDQNGLACLQWWRERCLEWCYDRVEAGRYADQKYLDDWPGLFNNLIVLSHKGANLAPWNLANYKLSLRGGQVWVDEQPLIFFHFHSFKPLMPGVYASGLADYAVKSSRLMRRHIYMPYIQTLLTLAQAGAQAGGIRMPLESRWQRYIRRSTDMVRIGKGILSGHYIFIIRGKAI